MTNFLDKYNPQTSIFAHYQIDQTLPAEERAFTAWTMLLSAKRLHDGLFLVIGKILTDVRDEKLVEKLDYENKHISASRHTNTTSRHWNLILKKLVK